jgi:hypothetical protein
LGSGCKTLTTNVTGHFAFFAEESSNRIILQQLHFFILLSSFYLVLLHQIFAEWIAIKRPNLSHVIPISLEITILLLVGFFGVQSDLSTLSGNGLLFNALFHGYKILW